MLAGERYIAADPELAAEMSRAAVLTERFNATSADDPDARRRVLVELLGAIGDGTEIRPPLYCDYGYHVRIGPRCFINFGAVFLDGAPVVVGADVQLGPYVQLLTATHPLEVESRRAKWETVAPIRIGDNVWLGAGVVVLPGVTIGPDTVVGAGSVVTRDQPGGVLAVGNPARVVRALPAR
jgi:maltose O-acetyltransferase